MNFFPSVVYSSGFGKSRFLASLGMTVTEAMLGTTGAEAMRDVLINRSGR
jgi:hypothetical protein